MNNKSYCRLPLHPAAISASLFLFATFLFPALAYADTPPWLRQAAQETMVNVPADANAIILFDEQETTVQPNGDIETLYRRAYRILRPGGREFGWLKVHFDNQTKITWLKAWCIPKDGKDYEVKEKDAIETGLSDEFYSDSKTKLLQIPAATPGSVIGYEYRQKQRPFVLQDEWWFQSNIPVRRSRFTINLPQGWVSTTRWIKYPEQKAIAESPTLRTWQVENIPPIKEEPAMPAVRAVVARMGITYHPSSGTTSALGPTDWDQIGVWYSALSANSRQSTPEIRQKVNELISIAMPWREKVQVLSSYVQSHVRYVAIEIGIGGYQPHAAGDIYKHQYGDCKDKATLLSAMLHEAGIDSYLVMAQTDRGIVAPDFASAITFNHAILAVPVPASEPVQDLFDVVETQKVGKLLFLDPTSTYTPFGYIPWYLQDNFVLVSTPQGGELVHLPLPLPATNKIIRQSKLELHLDGSLSGSVEETWSGGEGSGKREQLLSAEGMDRAKVLETFLAGFLRGFHLTAASTTDLDNVNLPLKLHYQFVADHYAKSTGDLLIIHPRVLGEKSSDVAEGEPRKFSVEYDQASIQTDDFEITLPPGYSVDDVPQATKTETEFASYTSQTQVTGNKIHYTRTYQMKQISVPLDKLDELKKFNRQVAADERSSVVLKRGGQ